MQQKLITFAVQCYNSAAYMRHCIRPCFLPESRPRSSLWTTVP